MKKLTLLIGIFAVAFTACKKKTDETTVDPTPALVTVGSVPSSFTQKVLVEEFTGAWCGYCPDGAYRMGQLVDNHPGKVYGASVHDGDVMSTSPDQYSVLAGAYTNTQGVPSGMINRIPYNGDVIMNRGYWDSQTTADLNKTAKCGVAIAGAALSGSTATITVHAGFKEAVSGTYNLTIYLIEDNVTGGSTYDQHNYMSSSGSSPDPNSIYYNQPPVMSGFKHMHVVRKVLTAGMGDAIPANKLVAGGDYTLTKTVDISAYNASNLKVIAFINKIGSTSTTHEIMNVQEASFYTGQLTGKNWD